MYWLYAPIQINGDRKKVHWGKKKTEKFLATWMDQILDAAVFATGTATNGKKSSTGPSPLSPVTSPILSASASGGTRVCFVDSWMYYSLRTCSLLLCLWLEKKTLYQLSFHVFLFSFHSLLYRLQNVRKYICVCVLFLRFKDRRWFDVHWICLGTRSRPTTQSGSSAIKESGDSNSATIDDPTDLERIDRISKYQIEWWLSFGFVWIWLIWKTRSIPSWKEDNIICDESRKSK